MQFNELLILLDPITAHQLPQLDIETSLFSIACGAIKQQLPEPIENLYFMTQEDVTQLERRLEFAKAASTNQMNKITK